MCDAAALASSGPAGSGRVIAAMHKRPACACMPPVSFDGGDAARLGGGACTLRGPLLFLSLNKSCRQGMFVIDKCFD